MGISCFGTVEPDTSDARLRFFVDQVVKIGHIVVLQRVRQRYYKTSAGDYFMRGTAAGANTLDALDSKTALKLKARTVKRPNQWISPMILLIEFEK